MNVFNSKCRGQEKELCVFRGHPSPFAPVTKNNFCVPQESAVPPCTAGNITGNWTTAKQPVLEVGLGVKPHPTTYMYCRRISGSCFLEMAKALFWEQMDKPL